MVRKMESRQNHMIHSSGLLPLKTEIINKDIYISWKVRQEKYDILSLYYNKDIRSCLQVIQLQSYSKNHSDLYEFFIPPYQSMRIIRNAIKTEYHSYRITLCLKLMDDNYLPLLTTEIGSGAGTVKLSSEINADWIHQVCGYSYYVVKQ